jgi:hypothetical protein
VGETRFRNHACYHHSGDQTTESLAAKPGVLRRTLQLSASNLVEMVPSSRISKCDLPDLELATGDL